MLHKHHFLLHLIIILRPPFSSTHTYTDILPLCSLSLRYALFPTTMVRKIDFLKGSHAFKSRLLQEQNLENCWRQAVQFQDFATPEALWEQIVETTLEDQSPLVINRLDNHPAWNANIFDFDGIKTSFNFDKAGRRYFCYMLVLFFVCDSLISIFKV